MQNGRIAGIGDFETPNLEDMKFIDCTNKIITHGFCDLHAHFRSFGEDDKEDFESGVLLSQEDLLGVCYAKYFASNRLSRIHFIC